MISFIFERTPLTYLVSSFWRDEAFSYLMAKQPLFSLLWSTAHDSNPPLYYLLLKVWMTIFGTSELALRSLSFIFFWATVYLVFKILHEQLHLSAKKSYWYLLLVILNPLLHYYAFEARMYTMMAFLGTALFYLLSKKNYSLYAISAVLALLTHYFLALILAFHFVYMVILHRHEMKLYIRPLIRAMVWYIPWIGVVLFARPPVVQQFWILPMTLNELFLTPSILLTGYEKSAWVTFAYLPHISAILWILFAYFFYRTYHAKNKRSLLFLYGGWALLIPLYVGIISFWKPVFLPRYLIFSSVGLTILIIMSIESIHQKYVKLGTLLLVIVLMFSYADTQVRMRTKSPLKSVFTIMRHEMKPSDVLYVTHEYDFHPAQYYLPNTKVFIYKKTYEELPWYVGKTLIHKDDVRFTLPIYPIRAFILSNGTYTIQSSR